MQVPAEKMSQCYKSKVFRRPSTVIGAACTIGVVLVFFLRQYNVARVRRPLCTTVKNLSYRRLQKNEMSKTVKHSAVKNFDVNFLGSNPQIEDRFVMGFSKSMGTGFFSVIDGHKGFSCAHYLQENLLKTVATSLHSQVEFGKPSDLDIVLNMNSSLILNSKEPHVHREYTKGDHPELPDSIIEQCLTASFGLTDDSISHQALEDVKVVMQGHPMTADMKGRILQAVEGACVSLAIVQSKSVSVATTGDCRAVIGREKMDQTWQAIPLSADQNAQNAAEVQRVMKAHPGEEKTLIVENRMLGSLMPFRTFGDVDFKWEKMYLDGLVQVWPNYLTPPYITAEPVVTHHEMEKGDRFMIIASDGLWEKMSSEVAVEIVAKSSNYFVKQGVITASDQEERCNAATQLLWHALGGTNDVVTRLLNIPPGQSRMFRDDITIIVVFFNE